MSRLRQETVFFPQILRNAGICANGCPCLAVDGCPGVFAGDTTALIIMITPMTATAVVEWCVWFGWWWW